MTTLTLTNVSHDLASLEMAGRLVYIERRARRLRVFTFAGPAESVEAGGLHTVGLVGTPIQAVKLAVKELEELSHD